MLQNALTHFAACVVLLFGFKIKLPIGRQNDKIEEKQMSKKFEELDFTDDFFFCKILMKNKILCIELLELVLRIKIEDIVFMAEQKPIEITADDISDEMREFLDYLLGKGAQNDFTRWIADEVNKARAHEEWRVEYMSLLLRDQEMRAVGREEGREEERQTMIVNMLKENIPVEAICRIAQCDEAYVKEIQKLLQKN